MLSREKACDSMLAFILEEIKDILLMNSQEELGVDINPGLIICILLSIFFVHFILKQGVNLVSKQHFTILLTYVINSLFIITLSLCLVYVLEEYILLKVGLQLVLIYGLCMTVMSLLFIFKKERKGV